MLGKIITKRHLLRCLSQVLLCVMLLQLKMHLVCNAGGNYYCHNYQNIGKSNLVYTTLHARGLVTSCPTAKRSKRYSKKTYIDNLPALALYFDLLDLAPVEYWIYCDYGWIHCLKQWWQLCVVFALLKIKAMDMWKSFDTQRFKFKPHDNWPSRD